MTALMFLAGLLALIAGAEVLVRGASRLARGLGVPPLVIGLTIVAFGTSAPELAVSLKSAMAGQASIAIGNVVGSNIFNVLFILGVSALISPLLVARQLIRFDVPVMIGASLLALALLVDGRLGFMDGSLLLLGLLVYTGVLFRQSQLSPTTEDTPPAAPTLIRDLIYVGGGLGLLVVGSRLLVDSAVTVAAALGVSQLVIGLTIVAIGTSLPEVVTSVVASLRGEREIAVGNVVGSNIFNILGVLGLAGIASPEYVAIADSVLAFDFPVMLAVAFACLPIFFTGGVISRAEGAGFFFFYLAYTAYVVLLATRNELLPLFRDGMLYFVLPLTLVTVLVLTVQALARKDKPPLPPSPHSASI